MSKQHKDGSDINSTVAGAWPRKDDDKMKDLVLDCILHMLLVKGLVRPAGLKNGETLYECTPDSELSMEAKAFKAYLYGPDHSVRPE